MGQKVVRETTKIIDMKGGPMINNRETPYELLISENCVINTVEKFKMTGGIQRHPGFRISKKKEVLSTRAVLYFVK